MRFLAAPAAGLFGIPVLLRRMAYDHGLLAASAAPLHLISVGGLEAGGSGKTPVTGLLLRAMQQSGRQVGLLTRGYGRQTRGLVLRRPGEPALPAVLGDEPAMLVESGLDVPVAACASRTTGAHVLAELGCDSAVMDDAFSHRAQRRHLDIVVLRGESPLGNGHLLPWGSLREPPSSLRRADVLWLHYRGVAAEQHEELRIPHAEHALRVVSEARATLAIDSHGSPVELEGQRVLALAGIARPTDLVASLQSMGAQVLGLEAFSDHHPYDRADVRRIKRVALQRGAAAVVTTAKDAVKLRALWEGPPLLTLPTRVHIRHGAAALASKLGISVETLVRQEPVGRESDSTSGV